MPDKTRTRKQTHRPGIVQYCAKINLDCPATGYTFSVKPNVATIYELHTQNVSQPQLSKKQRWKSQTSLGGMRRRTVLRVCSMNFGRKKNSLGVSAYCSFAELTQFCENDENDVT